MSCLGAQCRQTEQPLWQVLDEFYENLNSVGVSAMTGQGMDELFQAVDQSRAEYNQFYKAELDRRAKVEHFCLVSWQ